MEPEGEAKAEPGGVRDDIGEAERELIGSGKEQPDRNRDAELVLGRSNQGGGLCEGWRSGGGGGGSKKLMWRVKTTMQAWRSRRRPSNG